MLCSPDHHKMPRRHASLLVNAQIIVRSQDVIRTSLNTHDEYGEIHPVEIAAAAAEGAVGQNSEVAVVATAAENSH